MASPFRNFNINVGVGLAVLAGLLALGDGNFLGLGLSPTVPTQVGTSLGLSAVNAGIASDTVANMKTRYEARYNRHNAATRCMFLGGTADILDGGTASATYATAASLLNEMRTNGCQPVVAMPPPMKLASGWTVPRQSEFDIYRRSLQAYCNTYPTTTSCVDTYYDLSPAHDVLPQLSASYDSGDHLTLNQAGATKLATTISRGVTSGAAVYSSTSFPATITSPLAANSAVYCLAFTETANPDWSVNGSIMSIGTFGSSGSVTLYRGAASASAGGYTAWVYDNIPSGTLLGSSGGLDWPLGLIVYGKYTAAFCLDNGTATWWVDGINTSTTTVPTGITLNGTLYTGTASFLNSGNTLTSVCIAGPTGVVSADVTLAVQNSCGQFRVRNDAPVLGGVLPASGALVMAAFGDSITEKGGSVMRPWPFKLNALLGTGYNVIDDGHSGNQLADMKTLYDGTYHGHGTISRCLLLGGINDIFIAGRTGAATYALATPLLDEMRADGCRPIVVLPTPAKNTSLGWTSGKQTEYDSYRSSLAAYCVTNAATTTCVDTYGAGPSSGLGDGTSPPQMYSGFDPGDHTHPNQAGEDEIAQLVYAGATWP